MQKKRRVGVIKAVVESEEGEKRVKPTMKRKSVETEEEQRDQDPTAISDEGDNGEERGGCEVDSKQ